MTTMCRQRTVCIKPFLHHFKKHKGKDPSMSNSKLLKCKDTGQSGPAFSYEQPKEKQKKET